MKNRLISIIICIFGLYLIVSFSRDLWNLSGKGSEIEKVKLHFSELKMKNEELKKRLNEVQSVEFVEKEARNKLGLAKENETILVLPTNLKGIITLSDEPRTEKEEANWEKWWKLFF